MLPEQREQSDRSAYLRSGLLYLVAWLFVAGIEYRLIMDSSDIRTLFSNPLDRPYPVMLLGVSIILLALAIRDLSSWMRAKRDSHHSDV
ncbi:MAG: hypothetical protein ACR2Q3_10580 [Woeseiaceae bacterium]